MEFRRYLKERIAQLKENEALNVTETTLEGSGIRKVEFNPKTSRSLVLVPYHKKIVLNIKKDLRGLNNFLKLEGYDKSKIEKLYQSLRKSKLSSSRRDREVNPPPGSTTLNNPPVIYFYGKITYHKDTHSFDFSPNIFVKGNDGNFYYVYYYYYDSWRYDLVNYNIPDTNSDTIVDNDLVRLKFTESSEDNNVDVSINLDLVGDGNPVPFTAYGLTIGDNGFWFCKQLDGPLPNKIYYGPRVPSDLESDCYNRGIFKNQIS